MGEPIGPLMPAAAYCSRHLFGNTDAKQRLSMQEMFNPCDCNSCRQMGRRESFFSDGE